MMKGCHVFYSILLYSDILTTPIIWPFCDICNVCIMDTWPAIRNGRSPLQQFQNLKFFTGQKFEVSFLSLQCHLLICWFAIQHFTFHLIINVGNSCASAKHLCGNRDIFFQYSMMNRKYKSTKLMWNRYNLYPNKCFTFDFDQLNSNLMNQKTQTNKKKSIVSYYTAILHYICINLPHSRSSSDMASSSQGKSH